LRRRSHRFGRSPGLHFFSEIGYNRAGTDLRLGLRRLETMTMNQPDLLERITLDPAVCAGKPCVKGTRIYIAIVLDALAEGLTPEQAIDHYPQLTLDDIHAALGYAASAP